ncbi:TonB-dependent siderophore receptor [Acinetobacter guerrae]|uniref:TonB-dependent siderophore receptor n=1 Tax=Acinetobacter guerrae TaxID=1843371 RepID=A0A3A8ENA2_9GAMM|nr:TonB-dependent siderophore receptor [Acinetobacter guerrae]RKG35638.1 TonB-dependent siderophore receptor [Acinetobacter guerrae]
MNQFNLKMKRISAFKLSLLAMMIVQTHSGFAKDLDESLNTDELQTTKAVLPTIKIEAMSELDPVKSYIDYDEANVTRNGLKKKDIPQTIDTIDVQKYKIYGANDLSIMLQGTPGVSTSYDTRGDGIYLRGFAADAGDIYRDGVRESGQLRRSTANVERIEILKGPASVLYGRSQGGGVINMVTKFANFDSKSTVGLYTGSYNNVGATIDINRALNDNWAVRLTGEKADTNSFRKGIGSQIELLSPSVSYRNDDQTLLWTTQYTYDKLDRTPDRGPSYENLPKDVSLKTGFARPTDYIEDELQTIRTDLKYEFAPNWKFHWAASYRQAYQNFDNFFGGTWCDLNGKQITGAACTWKGYLRQSYAWQETMNKTLVNTFDITGKFNTGRFEHQIMFGSDWTHEDRDPKLGNYSSGTQTYYGYINPYQPSDYYDDLPENAHKTTTTINHHDAENLAFFLQDLITLTPTLKMMLGIRYDTFEFKTQAFVANSKPVDISKSYNGESLSPNVGFVWQPTDNHSFYTSYSKSFAPYGGRGTISIDPNVNDTSVYDAKPQYNEQYEIGVKSDWFDQRLNTQLSVFDITKNNIRYRPDPTNQPNEWQVGQQQQSKGVEFSFIGRVLDNVFVRGGYGYTDAKWTKDIRANVTPASRLKDNRLANISENTGNLFIRYLPVERVYAEVGGTYVGSFYTADNNLSKIDGWTRLDAALGYKDEHWGITFAVNNLTDKEYWRSNSMPGTPRNYLVRLNYQF